MPLIDKPLEELRAYRGTNPRPDDFDAFWAAGLAEANAVDLKVERVPNRFLSVESAECFDLRFTGVGGARIYAKYVRPSKAKGPCPTVLMFHGYSANSGYWLDKVSYANEGFCVLAMDCRGQGGFSEDRGGVSGGTLRGHIIRGLDDADPAKLLYRSIFLDTYLLAKVARTFPETDPDRLVTIGGSQGGALALACAALDTGIRRTVSIFPFLCDYRRVWDMDLAKDAYEELKLHLRRFDPRHERIDAMFLKLGYIDVQHLAPRIRADVLMITGLMDTVCPPSTQFAAYNKITSRKEMILYPDYGHEALADEPDISFNFLRKVKA